MKEVKLIKQNAMMKIMVGDELLEPAGYMTYNVDGDQFGAMEEMGNRIVFFGAYATDMGLNSLAGSKAWGPYYYLDYNTFDFTEIDRIGRDKALIKEELEWFKEKGVIVRILDVPTTLMEFPGEQAWVMELVNTILIELLGTIAEQEWKKIKKRREDGIKAMPVDEEGYKVSSKTGKRFGRAEMKLDLSLLPGETVKDACARLGISRNTYYRKQKMEGGTF